MIERQSEINQMGECFSALEGLRLLLNGVRLGYLAGRVVWFKIASESTGTRKLG